MTKEMKIAMVKDFFKSYPDSGLMTDTCYIGDGMWSLEVYAWMPDHSKEYLFDLVGSNGTRSESDDLFGDLEEIINSAIGILEKEESL